MTKIFLRSGNLDDFLALGENGQPVYTSALQLRETLRLRKQQHIADCLAIPQPNENGERINWYSPINGNVTSWVAASDEQRDTALQLLEQYQKIVAEISQRAQISDKPAQKLFGVLLAKAIQFPGPNHVYLVDDKPVLTFWGFVNLGKKSRLDALACLRPVEPPEIPEVIIEEKITPEPTPISVDSPVDNEPTATPSPASLPGEPTPSMATLATSNPWLRFWWLAPGAALLVTLVMQIRGCVFETPESETSVVATIKPEKRVLGTSEITVTKPQETLQALPVISVPVDQAILYVPPTPVKKAPETPATIDKTKDLLMMSAADVKIGSVSFLSGKWSATVNVKNPLTGTPPVLKYQIKNGKGKVRFTYNEGITCQADVSAGLHRSGNLVINSRYKAHCSDGSRYRIPEIICARQALTDVAECNAHYDADTILPVTIKRESK
ncbi:SrfA family protein [Pectobacteriaceae bacterium CE90]|nr:SrfA family protein [Pectobacteriaceae bacterium CE90]